uniref:Uncharacterized protein n=1 Tax=Sphaerodactylus townsendi TaxID=933632 RepID=A0ACB8GCM2_9SAUR
MLMEGNFLFLTLSQPPSVLPKIVFLLISRSKTAAMGTKWDSGAKKENWKKIPSSPLPREKPFHWMEELLLHQQYAIFTSPLKDQNIIHFMHFPLLKSSSCKHCFALAPH